MGGASAEAHATAQFDVAEARQVTAAVNEALKDEELAYTKEYTALEAEVTKLTARRKQLEMLDPNRPSQQDDPPPVDAALLKHLEVESAKGVLLLEQVRREKKASAYRLWAEEQLNDISRVFAAAKARAGANKKKR